METQVIPLVFVAGIVLFIVLIALLHPIIFKISVRNFARRKKRAVLIVTGLMFGTAMISGSLVTGETFNSIWTKDVYEKYDLTDELVFRISETIFTAGYFDYSVYEALAFNLSLSNANVDAISPLIVEYLPVVDTTSRESAPSITVIGCNFTIDRKFGEFVVENNAKIDGTTLIGNEAIINEKCAEELNAKPGDILLVKYSLLNTTTLEIKPTDIRLTVKYIVKNVGKANFEAGANIFVRLEFLQNAFALQGKINRLKISNTGGVETGAKYSDSVRVEVENLLNHSLGAKDAGISIVEVDFFYNLLVIGGERFFEDTFINSIISNQTVKHLVHNKTGFIVTPVRLRNDSYNLYNAVALEEQIFQLSQNDLIVSKRVARTNNLSEGSSVELDFARGYRFINHTFKVKTVLPLETMEVSEEFEIDLLMNLSFAKQILGVEGVNVIAIQSTNSTQLKSNLTAVFDAKISIADLNIYVATVKKDELEDAQKMADQIADAFLLLGLFCIASGIMLIIHIFVMLAEERKAEAGISRAIGMKRYQLGQTYLIEGLIYSFIAAVIGAFLGVLLAFIVVSFFGTIWGETGVVLPIFKLTTIITATCIGILITFLTILFAAYKNSRLNIVRAIRDIPEPVTTRKKHWVVFAAIFLLFFGGFIFWLGLLTNQLLYLLNGPCTIFVGIGILLSQMQSLPKKTAGLFTGLAILCWLLQPYELFPDAEGGMEMFFVVGLWLVLGGIILVLYNLDLILKSVTKVAPRRKKSLPVLKISFSYPLQKRFRTAMILAMFALIIFSVTVVAMVSSLQTVAIEREIKRASGGYDLLAVVNPLTPLPLKTELAKSQNLSLQDFKFISEGFVAYAEVYAEACGKENSTWCLMIGMDDTFFETTEFTFAKLAPEYKSAKDAFAAVRENTSLVLVDGTVLEKERVQPGGLVRQLFAVGAGRARLKVDVGDTIVVTSYRNEHLKKKVIGILEQKTFVGIFTSKEAVAKDFNVHQASVYPIKLYDPERAEEIASTLEKEYITYGMQTVATKNITREITSQLRAVMGLIEGLMGLGLIVGIAGLGIVTMRAVIERRHEIGVLRAIGFEKNMVFRAFLLEISYIALLGIFTGVFLGLGLTYMHIYKMPFFSGLPFVLPWQELLLIVCIAYGATMLATIRSARKATEIPPADALRYTG